MTESTSAPPQLISQNTSYIVNKNGADQLVNILQRRPDGQVYVHYDGFDKRLDEWIPGAILKPANEFARKRKRDTPSPTPPEPETQPDPLMTEEEFDIKHHKQITAQRNFDKVNFGQWRIKTWYFSPYPLTDSELEDSTGLPGGSASTSKIPGVNRATVRSHGRTSDLLAGGLTRSHLSGEKSILWVCDRCFKYMAEGAAWEMHIKQCDRRHPPGRKVYQRGAHIIWEVDGAKDKVPTSRCPHSNAYDDLQLYCQNLSLFGKLFIDVKTLFFDCDNFLFYILTDADSQRDHVLGFFSKEKISYDDYNLACIIVLPPYQRKGYGMLMIEFSYEVSRRAGKIGTPERPLSDLGLRSYLTYWVATLIRFFRRLLSVLPPDRPTVTSSGRLPDLTGVLPPPSEDANSRKKRAKGWDGETPDSNSTFTSPNGLDDTIAAMRTVLTTTNPDGSATSHVVVRSTLAEIASATNLRIEDAAFALNECGLLGSTLEGVVGITREMVEAVAKERNVKRMCLDPAHVMLT
ncbi:acyl-CoA N-acyltransferase [Suillus clintonianus]|uniref:acyl-CoA N-acyltransferase n=1 Tax=Suillus clintonianus TaxID=1904413 RepID=UPI001B881F95|nr:acyl-CoA N-acyltransferase [Suillus clintonianus]KAG2139660.1 acyl-CoA N-acyltransferase [Suillus clintonianus]